MVSSPNIRANERAAKVYAHAILRQAGFDAPPALLNACAYLNRRAQREGLLEFRLSHYRGSATRERLLARSSQQVRSLVRRFLAEHGVVEVDIGEVLSGLPPRWSKRDRRLMLVGCAMAPVEMRRAIRLLRRVNESREEACRAHRV